MADIDDLKLKLAAAEARAVAAEARAVAAEARAAAAEARAVAAEARIVALEKQVAELLEKLNRNSKNSNKPPSTESPAERLQRRAREQAREQQRTKDEAKKKRGGQPGHDGAQRALVPADQVDDVVDHRPVECENCWSPLPTIDDEHAQRSQTWELPPIRPEVIEHRFHAVTCPCCAHTTAAPFVPPPVFGTRGHGIVATLTGSYHLSRRKTAALLSDLMGLTISLGAVSDMEARVSTLKQVPRACGGQGVGARERRRGQAPRRDELVPKRRAQRAQRARGAVDGRDDGGDGVQDRGQR